MNSIFGLSGQIDKDVADKMARAMPHRGKWVEISQPTEQILLGKGCFHKGEKIYTVGGFSIVADADIYNLKSIKDLLKQKNIDIETDLPEEAILKLYRAEGIKGIGRINGDFAFAIWNNHNRQFIFGRDYCGCRPLFITSETENSTMAFATEYKALLQLPFFEAEPDIDMIQYLQHYKKVPVGKTLLKGVFEIQPGTLEFFDGKGVKTNVQKMEPARGEAIVLNEEEAVDHLHDALTEAIRCRVENRKEIGIALSGGIDSIGIAFICRRLFPQAEIHTFSAGYGDDSTELNTAAKVAKMIGSQHHPVITPPELIESQLQDLVWHLEDPQARSETLQLFLIGKTAKDYVDSLICGMEADALFGGMPRHKILRMMSKYPFFKSVLGEIYDLTQSGLKPDSLLGKFFEKTYLKNKVAPVPHITGSAFSPARTVFPSKRTQFINDFLGKGFQGGACQDGRKLERTFAAFGVRYQSPFLDRNLIRVAFSIDEQLKFKNKVNKYILRKTLAAWVPEDFRKIPKKPQRMRYGKKFADTMDSVAKIYINEERVAKMGFFNFSELDQLQKMKKNGIYPPEIGMRIWTAILTEIWADRFLKPPIV